MLETSKTQPHSNQLESGMCRWQGEMRKKSTPGGHGNSWEVTLSRQSRGHQGQRENSNVEHAAHERHRHSAWRPCPGLHFAGNSQHQSLTPNLHGGGLGWGNKVG